MNHLLNILASVGQAMNAFGSAPQYRYPKIGDRRKDSQKIAGDFSSVGRRLKKHTEDELNLHTHVKVHHSAASE